MANKWFFWNYVDWGEDWHAAGERNLFPVKSFSLEPLIPTASHLSPIHWRAWLKDASLIASSARSSNETLKNSNQRLRDYTSRFCPWGSRQTGSDRTGSDRTGPGTATVECNLHWKWPWPFVKNANSERPDKFGRIPRTPRSRFSSGEQEQYADKKKGKKWKQCNST